MGSRPNTVDSNQMEPTDPDDDVGAAAGELGSMVMVVPPSFHPDYRQI